MTTNDNQAVVFPGPFATHAEYTGIDRESPFIPYRGDVGTQVITGACAPYIPEPRQLLDWVRSEEYDPRQGKHRDKSDGRCSERRVRLSDKRAAEIKRECAESTETGRTRQRGGLYQRIADREGVSRGTIYNIANGRRSIKAVAV